MNENILNWNSHEFKVYLLLYVANADFELKAEEKQIILSKATKTEYQYIHEVFEKDSDFERIETILSYKEKFFPTEQDTEMLIKEIAELLNADGEYNLYERNFFRMLQKILRKTD
jgi:hypothetical protein